MSERVAKAESLVRQIVAAALAELLDADSAYVTVTAVDVAPDLKSAIIWIGLLGEPEIFERLQAQRLAIQRLVAAKMTTKFTPKLEFRLDVGGKYAEHISRLLHEG